MKYLTIVLMGLASSAWAFEQTNNMTQPLNTPTSIETPITGKLDLSSVANALHPCYVFDQHQDNLAGGYITFRDFHTADGVSLVDLNAGLIWDAGSGIGGPFASVGIRVDNLVARANQNQWVSKHTSGPTLPQIGVGPFAGYINRLGWLYGVFIAVYK